MKTETTIQANPKIQQSEKSKCGQYATYKPSNVEWLGDVPSHWKVTRIKDVIVDFGGDGFPIDKQGKKEGDYPFLKVSDINSKEDYVSTANNYATKADIYDNKWKIIPIQSMITAKVGEALKKNHRKINEVECCIDNNLMALVIDNRKKYSMKYFLYLSKEIDFDYFEKPGTVPSLNMTLFRHYKIPQPKLHEQTAIAAFLDQATANIDKVIATKQKQLEKLEQYKQSKIHECVTKGLNHDVKGLKDDHDFNSKKNNQRKNHGNHTNPKNQGADNMRPSGIDWIGDVPSHWRKIKLRYEIEIQSGEFVSNTELENGGDFPVFGGNGIMGYVSKFNIESERLIIGRVGAKCGNVHHVENSAWISDNALILTTYHNFRYLFYLLTEMNLNSISSQSAQPLITGTKIKNEYVVLPPIDEQIEIAKYLNDFTKKISKEKTIIEQQIEKLKQYRKSLIHECVTGKRKVVNE